MFDIRISHFQDILDQSLYGSEKHIADWRDRTFTIPYKYSREVFLLIDDELVSQFITYEEQKLSGETEIKEPMLRFVTDYAPEDQDWDEVEEEDRDAPYEHDLFAKGQWRMALTRVEPFLNEYSQLEAHILERMVLEYIRRGVVGFSWS